MPALATPAKRLKLSQLVLAALVLLNLFTKVSIFPNVQAYKAKKILYGMAAAHLLNIIKNSKSPGPPKVFSHPYPIMPPPMPYRPKCKKEMHYHEHLNVLGDKYGGGDDLGLDDGLDLDDHYSGGISSKHSYDDDADDIDDAPLYLDNEPSGGKLSAGRGSLQLGKKLRHRSRASRYLDDSDMDNLEEAGDGEGLDPYEDELAETETDYADSSEETSTMRRRPSGGKFKSPIKSGKKMFKKYIKIIKQKASDSFSGDEGEELPKGAPNFDEDFDEPQLKGKTIVTHVSPPGGPKKKNDRNGADEPREIPDTEASMMVSDIAAQNASQPKTEAKVMPGERRPKASSNVATTTTKPFKLSLKEKKEVALRSKSFKSMIKNMKISKYLKAGFESLGNRTAEMENWFKPRSHTTTPTVDEDVEPVVEDDSNQETTTTTTTTTTPTNPAMIMPTMPPPPIEMVQPVVPIYPPEMRPLMMGVDYPQYYPQSHVHYGLEQIAQPPLMYPPQQYQLQTQHQVFHAPPPQQQYLSEQQQQQQQQQIVPMDPSVPLYRSESAHSTSNSPSSPSSSSSSSRDPPESYYLDTALPVGPVDDLHPHTSSFYGHLIARRREDPSTLSSPSPQSSSSSLPPTEAEESTDTPTTITTTS